MKLFSTGSLAVIVLLVFTSCEKVIEIKLDDAAKKYVIEGNISNEPGVCTVRITQTKSFSGDNTFPGISGAVVTITDNGGAAIPLTESSAGNYSTSVLTGAPGHVYALKVVLAGQTFTASSAMQPAVNLDSIHVEQRLLFGDSTKTVYANYKDPATMGNAYHFIQYKNGVQEKTVFVINDDYTNGKAVSSPLFVFGEEDDKKLKSGDMVKIVMECIDTPIYKYWFSIDGATGESNNATPANPVSNFTGGALGYFSAHTTQSKTIIVP